MSKKEKYRKQNNASYNLNQSQQQSKMKNTSQNLNIDLSPEELNSLYSHFSSKVFNQGITKDIDIETIQKWLSNPEDNKENLSKLAQYYYVSNGDVFQLFDLTRILPSLNYKIKCFQQDKQYYKNITICNKGLNLINHRELTRDIITQLITSGTVTGLWIGDKKNQYPIIFDDLEYFFPAYRKNGKWVVWVDLSYFDNLSEIDRIEQLENLSPYVTQNDYNEYKADSTKTKYVELPIERSICLRTHTIKRNQRFGIPWVTQGIFEIMHKKKLKDLEKSVANKIINAIAVMKIGDKENPNLKMNKKIKKKVYGNAKEALEKNQAQGITVIGLPEWGSLEFPEMKSDALNPDKFESINDDITSSLGYSKALTNGNKANYASAKLNLDILYRRIGEILEIIEIEVYSKLFGILLPKNVANNYSLVYDKNVTLTNKEKIDVLKSLHSEGFAIKPIIDALEGVDYEEYIEQSIYEIETLKLRDKIIPPMLSYTTSGKEGSGAPANDNPNNESTIQDKTQGGSETPRANV